MHNLHHLAGTTLLAALFTTLPLSAQNPCEAHNSGNTYNDRVSMGGPNYTNCLEFTASSNALIFAVQVFTGERPGTSTVGLWTATGTGGTPGMELATGSFQINTTNSWQGANLSKPVLLTQGTKYYVSWIPVNGCQATVDDSSAATHAPQQYYWSKTNSAPWNGPYKGHPWKFRLWCAPLANAVTTIGSGCKDGIGALGLWDASGTPNVGNQSFALTGKTLPPNQPAIVALGSNPSFQSVDLRFIGAPGCFLHTDILGEIGARTSAGAGQGKSDGTLNVPVPIPNNGALKGAYLRSQLWVADPRLSSPLQAVFTNGLGITVQ